MLESVLCVLEKNVHSAFLRQRVIALLKSSISLFIFCLYVLTIIESRDIAVSNYCCRTISHFNSVNVCFTNLGVLRFGAHIFIIVIIFLVI